MGSGHYVRGSCFQQMADPDCDLSGVLSSLLILVIVGGYRIVRRSFAPVASMSKAARAIGETGDLSQRLPVGEGSDEIHQMGRTMNHMLDQIEDLMGREKRFTSDVSHELRTPIAVIMAESEFGKDYAENVEEAKRKWAGSLTRPVT